MLSRKDYKAVAEIMKEAIEDMDGGTPCEIILVGIRVNLAEYFEQDNPRFGRQKFYDACFNRD